MTHKHQVTEQIFTHKILWREANDLFEKSERAQQKGERNSFLSSLLFYFLAYEAFINFSGYLLLPDIWEKEKEYFKGNNAGLESKIKKIVRKFQEEGHSFNWEKGQSPYQRIKLLEDFRHAIVHGKVIANKYTTILKDEDNHIRWDMPWDKFIQHDEIKQSKKDIRLFCQSLLDVMRQCSDHHHLTYDAFEGPLGNAQGESQ